MFEYIQILGVLLQAPGYFTAMLALSSENNKLIWVPLYSTLLTVSTSSFCIKQETSSNKLSRAKIHFSKTESTGESLKTVILT